MNNVAIIIPTLNCGHILKSCLKSIKKQSYQDYNIYIVDGGSTDNTLEIAKKHHTTILKNPLKTAEAGKAIGVKHSFEKYIALIDSDNILPSKSWLETNIKILSNNPIIIGTEPLYFAYRKKAGYIERYSSLIGANDPYAFISGVYDRQNFLNNRWTNLPISQVDNGNYFQVELKPNLPIPTIGANGTIFRSKFIKNNLKSDYLFDIDIISNYLTVKKEPLYFAKVKQGIIHTFCESSIKKFTRKQFRRLTDYYQYQNLRQYDWNQTNKLGTLKFILYITFVFPMLFDTIKGFIRKPDVAWFAHPILCIITLYCYTITTVKQKLMLLKPVNRQQWTQ